MRQEKTGQPERQGEWTDRATTARRLGQALRCRPINLADSLRSGTGAMHEVWGMAGASEEDSCGHKSRLQGHCYGAEVVAG